MQETRQSGTVGRSAAALGFLGIFERNTRLQNRLEVIMNTEKTHHKRNAWGWALVALFAIVFVPIVGAQTKDETPPKHWVRVVLDANDALTFEGQETTLDALPSLLEKVPDRPNTVLTLSVTSDDMRLAQVRPVTNKLADLVKKLSFKYLSEIENHPAGSYGISESSFKNALLKKVTVDADKSPDGSGLTYQYAAAAVCNAAGIPFDWASTEKLAEPERRAFTQPLRVKDVSVEEALLSALKKSGLRFDLSERGLYLYKPGKSGTDQPDNAFLEKLNDQQKTVYDWTHSNFRRFFDDRTFPHLTADERGKLEDKLIDTLKGPRNNDYYLAINSLSALSSTKAVPALSAIAFDRAEKDNRDRWMAVRALGIIGDQSVIPQLIHLVYYPNLNTRFWAQISLVRLTGQNYGNDWQAWGKWWTGRGAMPGMPAFVADKIAWSSNTEYMDIGKQREADAKWVYDISIKQKPTETTTSSAAAPAATSWPKLIANVADGKINFTGISTFTGLLAASPCAGSTESSQLGYVGETTTEKMSLGASGHAVEFKRPGKASFIEAVDIFAGRYGKTEPPKEDFILYVLNKGRQVLAELRYPYAMIERADMKWHTLRTAPIETPEQFMIALVFNPHQTKGIYLGWQKAAGECHSFTGLPDSGYEPEREGREWMVRACLTEKPSAEHALRLADWKPPVTRDPFKGLVELKHDTGKSDGMQSYGGRGPAIQFDLRREIPGLEGGGVQPQPETGQRVRHQIRGLRVYGSRYGSGYDPEQTSITVTVREGNGRVAGVCELPYALFSYKEKWVDLPFAQPITIEAPGLPVTIGIDPKAHQTKGIYFHYNKTDGTTSSTVGTAEKGYEPVPDREWIIRAYVGQ
ncbi:MAG: HEAT repeat domain-containing protein [Candidatus Sumerlaeota bacterium]|nr:HEAT repeat domain-containing protein [Candidatus Sumerlaeota bacterium]